MDGVKSEENQATLGSMQSEEIFEGVEGPALYAGGSKGERLLLLLIVDWNFTPVASWAINCASREMNETKYIAGVIWRIFLECLSVQMVSKSK